MIRIIKHGLYRKMTCPNCRCEFTYEKADTNHVQTDVNDYKRFVECPDCGERIEVVCYD